MMQLSRAYTIFVCKDGNVTYAPRGAPPFNGVALPVHSTDSIEEAHELQLALCRRQYISHPLMPGQPWYVLTDFSGKIEDLWRVAKQMQRVSRHIRETRKRTVQEAMKQYIITWTITIESDSADGALETALDAMAAGNISPEVEEITDQE